MTADPQEATTRPADGAAGIPTAASGFAGLAKRISSWTSKGVVTALVVLAGVAFGRQVLQWWAAGDVPADPAAPPAAVADGLGDPAREHRLQFGESPWSMTRRTLTAAKGEALAALRASCAEVVGTSRPPAGDPGAAEKELLALLGECKPIQEEPGHWALYELDEPNLMVVGIRRDGTGAKPAAGPVAATGHRVVTWGLAIPAGPRSWTLFGFSAAPSSSGDAPALEEIPLPPGSARVLSMRVSGGGALVSFRGPAEVESWKGFFDAWLRSHDWRPSPWRRLGSRWHLHGAMPGGKTPGSFDLQFGPDARGQLIALLVIAPPDAQPTQGKSP